MIRYSPAPIIIIVSLCRSLLVTFLRIVMPGEGVFKIRVRWVRKDKCPALKQSCVQKRLRKEIKNDLGYRHLRAHLVEGHKLFAHQYGQTSKTPGGNKFAYRLVERRTVWPATTEFHLSLIHI